VFYDPEMEDPIALYHFLNRDSIIDEAVGIYATVEGSSVKATEGLLPEQYTDFKDIFSENSCKTLPPLRGSGIDLEINLVEGTNMNKLPTERSITKAPKNKTPPRSNLTSFIATAGFVRARPLSQAPLYLSP
jgi:hypothetical protein